MFMIWSSAEDLRCAEAVSALTYCNPFLSERIELEQRVLGKEGVARPRVWTPGAEPMEDPAIALIQQRAESLLRSARRAIDCGESPTPHEVEVYDGVVLYVLYYRYQDRFFRVLSEDADAQSLGAHYDAFVRELVELTAVPGLLDRTEDAAHLFALLYQIRRAFHFVFRGIFGGSLVVARLRATVWQSIFTDHPFRHQRFLYRRMHELTTLVTGPSGTGKELVARAIGFSAYIPFDRSSKTFAANHQTAFHPINVSAFSKTLVESELFGHKKGAFTGATSDRAGYLHAKSAWDVVFLDEIGELDPEIQVKLLRVLQTREFQRLGDNHAFGFGGKIIAATNRNLSKEMSVGTFRRDLFYRLCSDVIETPSLHEIVSADPHELRNLVVVIVNRLLGEDDLSLVDQVLDTIETTLGASYVWPGNIRELEQIVRNVLVRGSYVPLEHLSQKPIEGGTLESAWARIDTPLTLDALIRRYCTYVYARTGTFEDAAEVLDIDRRTVSRYVDRDEVERLRTTGTR